MDTEVSTFDDPLSALEALGAEFFGPDLVAEAVLVPREDVPPPFDALLVHEEHMTTSLQRYHGTPIALEVLEDLSADNDYMRKILLTTAAKHVVEVGVARIDLQYTSDEVRAEILERKAPLGDILIRHKVLRRIEPKWFFRFEGPGPLLAAFDRPLDGPVYGRVGIIYCDEAPAIELLEVVSPDKVE